MSSSSTPQIRSPYLGPGPAGTPWSAVLVRAFLIMLPALLVGFFLGVLVFGSAGADHPRLLWGINVLPGVVTGVALGLLLVPVRARLLAYLGVTAAMGVVLVGLLLALAQTRVSGSSTPAVSPVVGGMALTVIPQTVVAGLLWWRRVGTR